MNERGRNRRWSVVHPVNAFDSRLWGDKVPLGSSPTKSYKKTITWLKIFSACLELPPLCSLHTQLRENQPMMTSCIAAIFTLRLTNRPIIRPILRWLTSTGLNILAPPFRNLQQRHVFFSFTVCSQVLPQIAIRITWIKFRRESTWG